MSDFPHDSTGSDDGTRRGRAPEASGPETDPGLGEQLRAEIDAAIDRDVPGRIADLVRQSAARASLWRRRARFALAVPVALALFAAGWGSQAWLGEEGPAASPSSRAAMIFSEDTSAGPLEPASGAAAFAIGAPPDLDQEGFRLRAVSQSQAHHGVLNRLDYRGPDGEEIRVLIHDRGDGISWPPEQADLDGNPIVFWREGPLTIGVTGTAPAARLERIAESIHRQLDEPVGEALLAESPAAEETIVHDLAVLPESQN